MKLVAAKCPNCGAKIKLNKEEQIYFCEYCKYNIILDDSNNAMEKNSHLNSDEHKVYLNTDELKNIPKFMSVIFIIPIIFFIIVASIIFMSVNSFFENTSTNIENITDDVSTSTFNVFIDEIGVVYSISVANILEEVIKNIDDYDKEITIVYDGVVREDLQTLILEIDGEAFTEFEVTNEKDSEGYINKIYINTKN